MPSFTYTRDRPDGPNNPSVDQPVMKVNTNSIDDILAVDHVSFNTAGGGEHEQVTFNGNNIPIGIVTDPTSVFFTKNNTAGHPYPFFLNSEAAAVINALPFLPDLVTSGTNYGFKIGTMIFNFGSGPTAPTVSSITFAVPMTNVFSCVLGGISALPVIRPTPAISGTGFSWNSVATNTSYYFSIGN